MPPRRPCTTRPQGFRSTAVHLRPIARESSAKGLSEGVDKRVENCVLLAKLLDFSNRVNDGGVVFAAETFSDFRQGCRGERLAEIHRHLPWHRDGLGIIARL